MQKLQTLSPQGRVSSLDRQKRKCSHYVSSFQFTLGKKLPHTLFSMMLFVVYHGISFGVFDILITFFLLAQVWRKKRGKCHMDIYFDRFLRKYFSKISLGFWSICFHSFSCTGNNIKRVYLDIVFNSEDLAFPFTVLHAWPLYFILSLIRVMGVISTYLW